jgi:hypothetical protein
MDTKESPEGSESSPPEKDQADKDNNNSSENEEEEKDSQVSRTEFDNLSSEVNGIHDILSSVQETLTNLAVKPGEKKEEAPPEHKDDTPISPDIKIDNPIEYLYVRKRGGRVVKREKSKA